MGQKPLQPVTVSSQLEEAYQLPDPKQRAANAREMARLLLAGLARGQRNWARGGGADYSLSDMVREASSSARRLGLSGEHPRINRWAALERWANEQMVELKKMEK